MKKIYIQPDCKTVMIKSGCPLAFSNKYSGPLGSRGSDLFFWEDESAGDCNSGRSCRDDFDDDEEDY
jgi:hypothetical protein